MTTLTYTVKLATESGPAAPPAPRRARLLLEFKDPVNDAYRQTTLVLDADTPQRTWQIDVGAADAGQAFYSSVLDYEASEQVARPPVAFVGTQATVGGPADPVSVVALLEALDWAAVSSVRVAVGGASHTFSRERPHAWWFAVPAPGIVEWRADYAMTDGTTRSGAGVATQGVAVIPAPPVEVGFSIATADLDAFAVAAVALRVTGHDGVTRSAELGKTHPDATLSLPYAPPGQAWFAYDWTVTYTDGTPPWTAPARSSDGATSIVLGDFGRILLASDKIDFDVVGKVTLSWRYNNTPKSAELSRAQRSVLLRPDQDYDRAQPLIAGLSYVLSSGSTNLEGEAVPQGRFEVPYPLGTRLVRVFAPGLLATPPLYSAMKLTSVQTLELGAGWQLQNGLPSISLTPGAPTWETRVAAVDPERVALIFSGTATPAGGGRPKQIAETRSPFELTPAGPEIPLATVQVSAQSVDWERYARVEASLWTGSDAQRENEQTVSFDRNSADAWWAYLPAPGAYGPSFRWSATYYPADGASPLHKAPTAGDNPRLSLPPTVS
ncbi:hypothetical protein GQ57_36275 [Burkholderia sp. MSh2]|uniref:Uncharacterized protein n=1 Tax=Burkholderia paludis TaxID=1506587 RepID=A0A6P2H481_9BURK|nr:MULTISPECIES: hypothetical protein [Burkholderia]KEZ01242.1 hypothetical protein GQ57_36275 [Burkholderia sp. MSh2]CAB3750660.1 hypothetical protein LMG30113_01260 [Burkholderia paludis]VWB11047.1 hypothetical protein BPA30113_00217 [Burkholderia paludis]